MHEEGWMDSCACHVSCFRHEWLLPGRVGTRRRRRGGPGCSAAQECACGHDCSCCPCSAPDAALLRGARARPQPAALDPTAEEDRGEQQNHGNAQEVCCPHSILFYPSALFCQTPPPPTSKFIISAVAGILLKSQYFNFFQ